AGLEVERPVGGALLVVAERGAGLAVLPQEPRGDQVGPLVRTVCQGHLPVLQVLGAGAVAGLAPDATQVGCLDGAREPSGPAGTRGVAGETAGVGRVVPGGIEPRLGLRLGRRARLQEVEGPGHAGRRPALVLGEVARLALL